MSRLRPGGPTSAGCSQWTPRDPGGRGPHLAHLTHPPSAVLHTLVQPSVPQPRGGKEPCEGKTGHRLAGPACDLPLAPDQGWAGGSSVPQALPWGNETEEARLDLGKKDVLATQKGRPASSRPSQGLGPFPGRPCRHLEYWTECDLWLHCELVGLAALRILYPETASKWLRSRERAPQGPGIGRRPQGHQYFPV